jgi:hypothetical protein
VVDGDLYSRRLAFAAKKSGLNTHLSGDKCLTAKQPPVQYVRLAQAGIAQLVEHNLAKVGVASSNLVSRSIYFCGSDAKKVAQESKTSILRSGFFSVRPAVPVNSSPLQSQSNTAEWQSGYAADCKSVYLGSTPGSASIFFNELGNLSPLFISIITPSLCIYMVFH